MFYLSYLMIFVIMLMRVRLDATPPTTDSDGHGWATGHVSHPHLDSLVFPTIQSIKALSM